MRLSEGSTTERGVCTSVHGISPPKLLIREERITGVPSHSKKMAVLMGVIFGLAYDV